MVAKNAAEEIPAAIRISEHRCVWLRSELLAWLKAGAPKRDDWENQRARTEGTPMSDGIAWPPEARVQSVVIQTGAQYLLMEQ